MFEDEGTTADWASIPTQKPEVELGPWGSYGGSKTKSPGMITTSKKKGPKGVPCLRILLPALLRQHCLPPSGP